MRNPNVLKALEKKPQEEVNKRARVAFGKMGEKEDKNLG